MLNVECVDILVRIMGKREKFTKIYEVLTISM